MVSRRLIPIITLFIPWIASAQITIQNINPSTYSFAEGPFFGSQVGTVNTIYGGVAGTCSGTLSPSSTCNSCIGATTSCNAQRVHDQLRFQVTIVGTQAGVPLVTNNLDNGAGQAAIPNITANVPLNIQSPANTAMTVSIPWEEICELAGGTTGCTGVPDNNTRVQLRIGIDTDINGFLDGGDQFTTDLQFVVANFSSTPVNLCQSSGPFDGPCNFIAYPGDSKVFIQNVRAGCSFPALSGSSANATSIRVFYEPSSADGVPDISSPFADLRVNQAASGGCSGSQEINIADNEVGGLSNGTAYTFTLGVVDQARNVGGVIDVAGVEADNTSARCYDPDGEWQFNCHMATPDEVLSLIQEEFDCFITTAAYGSPFASKVKTFREFRNRYLKTHLLGRSVIESYYVLSPPVAKWIDAHPMSKWFVRLMLWPLWALAWLSLQFPWAVLMALVTLTFVIGRRRFGVRA